MGGHAKGLISLDQMKRENLRKDLRQIFQSCTFNRSVTSPTSGKSYRTSANILNATI